VAIDQGTRGSLHPA